MTIVDPRSPGFQHILGLVRRMDANPSTERKNLVSVEDRDVPSWQRQTVWNEEEMGLLVYSILRNYPIGLLILWVKPDGARVPIDGRQRLTAIRKFYKGEIALPHLPLIPDGMRGKKYKLLDGDKEAGFSELTIDEKEIFDGYPIKALEYADVDENTAMEIFVMLQGGKSLTKTEVRAALGGKLCDFVTELTSGPVLSHNDNDESDDEDIPSKHIFFKDLTPNLRNIRKAHRAVADVLLHEFLSPGVDKHWSSLEKMYREKADTLTEVDRSDFHDELARFRRSVRIKIGGRRVLIPQLRTTYFILSAYKCWRELLSKYDMPDDFVFADELQRFETERVQNPKRLPWVSFTAALSNAGYAQNKIQERHDILMGQILLRHPDAKAKKRDRNRSFTIEQKIAIWERAKHQCEHSEGGKRCSKVFPNPREADADHIVRWSENGPTTVENGRLLCQRHNRARR